MRTFRRAEVLAVRMPTMLTGPFQINPNLRVPSPTSAQAKFPWTVKHQCVIFRDILQLPCYFMFSARTSCTGPVACDGCESIPDHRNASEWIKRCAYHMISASPYVWWVIGGIPVLCWLYSCGPWEIGILSILHTALRPMPRASTGSTEMAVGVSASFQEGRLPVCSHVLDACLREIIAPLTVKRLSSVNPQQNRLRMQKW